MRKTEKPAHYLCKKDTIIAHLLLEEEEQTRTISHKITRKQLPRYAVSVIQVI